MEVTGFDLDRIAERLREWAVSHPSPNTPFMAMMEESRMRRVELTPMQFADEVKNRTPMGWSYVRYLEEMSRSNNEDIVASIDRAIRANKLAG